ncbi:DsbA family protein [Alcaligenaceae bacterium A4P071]|nr:DsbA family protein [Alcaligenaceae bacterium A4P071]
MTTLHYIYDPFCGWCYAAAPLVAAARSVPHLDIALHGGGMLAGANRRTITPDWREHVMPHDKRIAQLTGQPFGEAYFDGLLRDVGAVMDSEQPIAAILAAQDVSGQGLDMLEAAQHAHYVKGLRIADPAVLSGLAGELGMNAEMFRDAFDRMVGAATHEHIGESRARLAQLGGRGFPTFALETGDGQLERVDISVWLGHTDEWRDFLSERSPEISVPRRDAGV